MKKAVYAGVATVLLTLIPASAMAFPHAVFQDSDQWVAHPNDLTPSGAYAWAFPEMSDAAAWEVVNGYPGHVRDLCVEGTTFDCKLTVKLTEAPLFKPADSMSRAEFATVLSRANGMDQAYRSDGTQPPFSDIQPNGWYVANIGGLYQNGVIRVADYGDQLHPDDPITRAELAVWTARATEAGGRPLVTGDLSKFTDEKLIPIKYRADVAKAVNAGIIKGSVESDGQWHLNPLGTAKRVEATAMMIRSLYSSDQTATADLTEIKATVTNGLTVLAAEANASVAAHISGGTFVGRNSDHLHAAFAPYFTTLAIERTADMRPGSARNGTGYGTWPGNGYSVLESLVIWTVPRTPMRVNKITPITVLDGFAKVEVQFYLGRMFRGLVDENFTYEIALKKLNGSWKMSNSQLISIGTK